MRWRFRRYPEFFRFGLCPLRRLTLKPQKLER
jgi:hypothetical protein